MASAPANDSADNKATADDAAPGTSGAAARTGKKAASGAGRGQRSGTKKGAPGKKASGKKAPGNKQAGKKGAAKKAAAEKAAGGTAGRAAASMQAGTRSAGAKRSFAGRFTRRGKKSTPEPQAGTPQGESSPGARTAKKGKRSPAKKAAARKQHARRLVVREDEAPWTPKELQDVRRELQADAKRLQGEIAVADNDVRTLMRDNGDGAGNDQADVGSNTFERDHEMAIVAQHREMLEQVDRALSRIRDGSYGICERCGNPIGKMRLMAFPRATLCVPCKQREERR